MCASFIKLKQSSLERLVSKNQNKQRKRLAWNIAICQTVADLIFVELISELSADG